MAEKIIDFGIIFLLIYTPLAIGGGSEFSVMLLETMSGVLFVVWLVKIFARRHRSSHHHRVHDSHSNHDHHQGYSIHLATSPLFVPFCLFCGVIVGQLIPLPSALVNTLSPHTYQLYTEWASYTGATIPNWLPVTIYAHATEGELYKFLAYAALFVVIINTMRSQPQQKRIIYTIITVGLLEALYSFAQFSGYHLPYLKPDQANWLASGTFLNRNHLAGYLEMVIPLTCGVLFLCLGKSGPFPLKRLMALFDEQYLKALLILFLIGVMICALLLSGSRGGMLSFAASMIFLCLLAFMRRGLRKWALVVMIFLLLTLGVALLSSPERAIKRLDALTKPDTEQSFTYRKDVWQNSLLIWRDFPIFGSGLGSFAHIFRRYQGFVSDLFFAYAESDYVQLVVETGIVGTLLMFWLGILFFYRTIVAWKQRRSRWTMTMAAAGLSAVFSLCIHSGVDFNLHVPSNAVTFTVIAALSYVAAHTHRKSKR